MISKSEFLEEIEKLRAEMTQEAQEYLEELKANRIGVPKTISDKGKVILKDMQDNEVEFKNIFKSKDIGERIGVSGRSVSGSIRALIALGYVEKNGVDPVTYGLTDLGRNFSVDN